MKKLDELLAELDGMRANGEWPILTPPQYDILRAALREREGMAMVPREVESALRYWSGHEPSQSILARAVDKWLAAAGPSK